MVVVFDTDVIIPLILGRNSRSFRLYARLRQAGHKVAISPQILAEVREKMFTKERLRSWLKVSDEEIKVFLNELPIIFIVVSGTRQAHGVVKADPDDDKIIAAALEAKAEYLISEDRHLRELGQYRGIKVLSRDQFEDVLEQLGVPPAGFNGE